MTLATAAWQKALNLCQINWPDLAYNWWLPAIQVARSIGFGWSTAFLNQESRLYWVLLDTRYSTTVFGPPYTNSKMVLHHIITSLNPLTNSLMGLEWRRACTLFRDENVCIWPLWGDLTCWRAKLWFMPQSFIRNQRVYREEVLNDHGITSANTLMTCLTCCLPCTVDTARLLVCCATFYIRAERNQQ